METQKIVNLLGDADSESSKFAMLSMIKKTHTMVKEVKMVQPLNLKSKSLNKIFVIIQTHIFM